MSDIEQLLINNYGYTSKSWKNLTSKRKEVLSILLSSVKALSAYEVVESYKDKFAIDIKAMSVYRILDFLKKEKYIHKISSSNKYIACRNHDCQNSHSLPLFIICDKCQTFKEISINPNFLSSLEEEVMQIGFEMKTPQLELSCVCKNCC